MEQAYTNNTDEIIRLVQDRQLKDRSLWQLAAKQFKGTPDDVDLGWRGEYWGKLMRGACQTWKYTKDEETLSDFAGIRVGFIKCTGRGRSDIYLQ